MKRIESTRLEKSQRTRKNSGKEGAPGERPMKTGTPGNGPKRQSPCYAVAEEGGGRAPAPKNTRGNPEDGSAIAGG